MKKVDLRNTLLLIHACIELNKDSCEFDDYEEMLIDIQTLVDYALEDATEKEKEKARKVFMETTGVHGT